MADEKIYTNIGAVTAYAYAKEMGGYEGTPQQFATDQANFAKNAQQVREDKESVEATVETFDNTTVPAAVQTVTAEGTRQVGIVGTAGDTQVGVVQTEGTTQKNAVQAKGNEVIASIPSDYTELTEEVEDLKSSRNSINLFEPIPDTTETVNFDSNGKPSSIVHTNGTDVVRTDAFTWGSDNTVTETRTLADGKYIVMVTDLTTLVTTISEIQEGV